MLLLLLPLEDGGLAAGFPLLGELLGLVLLGLLVSGVVLLGLLELGLIELGLLLGEAEELSGEVLELLLLLPLGEADVCPDWSCELCPAVELLGEVVL